MPLTRHNMVPKSAQRLEINQSKKNPYLLKRSPSSNLRTLLLGPTRSYCRNANESRKKPSASLFLFFFPSFLSFLSFFSPFTFSLFLSSLLLLPSTIWLLTPLFYTNSMLYACGHMDFHVSHMHLPMHAL